MLAPLTAPVMKVYRSCHCYTPGTIRVELPPGDFPPGYCGVCHLCGAASHTSQAPIPPYESAGWCDRCYIVARFRDSNEPPGAFFYNASDRDDDPELTAEDLNLPRLEDLLSRLQEEDSRLLVRFPNGIGVFFWVLWSGAVEMSFGDPARELYGSAELELHTGCRALKAALAGEDLREALGGLNVSWFAPREDPDTSGDAPQARRQ